MSTSVSLVCSSPRSPPPRGKLPTLRPNSSRQRGHGTSSSPQPNRLRSPPSSKRRGESNARWGRSGQARKRAPPHSELVSRAAPSPSVRPTQQGGGTGPRCSACFALTAWLPSRKAKRYRVCAGAVGWPRYGGAWRPAYARSRPPPMGARRPRPRSPCGDQDPCSWRSRNCRARSRNTRHRRPFASLRARVVACDSGQGCQPRRVAPRCSGGHASRRSCFPPRRSVPMGPEQVPPGRCGCPSRARLGWSWLAPHVPMSPAPGGGGDGGWDGSRRARPLQVAVGQRAPLLRGRGRAALAAISTGS